MIFDIKKELCSGCGACVSICPKNTLVLLPDSEGFLYPHKKNHECIDCGLCETVCPSITPFPKRDPQKAIAVRHKDIAIRQKSSSGGIFTAFAKSILSNNGVVCGAAFDENYEVHHVCITDVADLHYLIGSKYVQSRIEGCYTEIKKYLKEGKKVLFVGTPCQTAGLNSFLKKCDTSELISVELCCHAVPSPLIWRSYLKENNIYPSEISFLSFRSKANGVKNYSLEIKTNKGVNILESKLVNYYMRGFLENLYCRPICSQCRFRQFATNSDFSIGDFWGIEKYYPQKDDNLGCNQVLIHTNKGIDFFKKLSLDEYDVFPITIGEAILGNTNYVNSSHAHINRELFWKLYNSGCRLEKAICVSLKIVNKDNMIIRFKNMIRVFLCKK